MQFGSEEVCLGQCLNSHKSVIVKLIMKSMVRLFVDITLCLEAVCDKLSIKFYEEGEEYEKCAFLKEQLDFIKSLS